MSPPRWGVLISISKPDRYCKEERGRKEAGRRRPLLWKLELLQLLTRAVMPTSLHAKAYKERGYSLLQSVLSNEDITTMRSSIISYIDSDGALLRPYGLGDFGGWYCPDFPREKSLSHILAIIDGKRALHRVLEQVLGKTYDLLSRNEFYVSRFALWHMDTVWEPSAARDRVPAYALDRNPMQLWSTLANGESYGIATVAVYLQDHTNDSRALTVRPASHASSTVALNRHVLERRSAETLHPRQGDVVIFDSRLSHRGQGREYANFQRVLRDERIVLSFNYGRRDAFSESHFRSFRMRNHLVLNTSLCNGNLRGDCAEQAVARDVARTPLVRSALGASSFATLRGY